MSSPLHRFLPHWPDWRDRWQRLAWLSMILWSVLAGLIGAFATESFRLSMYWGDRVLLGQGGSLVALARSLPPLLRVLAPALGGVLAGLLLLWVNRFTVAGSKTDYMDASTMGDGRIPIACACWLAPAPGAGRTGGGTGFLGLAPGDFGSFRLCHCRHGCIPGRFHTGALDGRPDAV